MEQDNEKGLSGNPEKEEEQQNNQEKYSGGKTSEYNDEQFNQPNTEQQNYYQNTQNQNNTSQQSQQAYNNYSYPEYNQSQQQNMPPNNPNYYQQGYSNNYIQQQNQGQYDYNQGWQQPYAQTNYQPHNQQPYPQQNYEQAQYHQQAYAQQNNRQNQYYQQPYPQHNYPQGQYYQQPYSGQYYAQPKSKPRNPQKRVLWKTLNKVGFSLLACVVGYMVFASIAMIAITFIVLTAQDEMNILTQWGFSYAQSYVFSQHAELTWFLQGLITVLGCGIAILMLRKLLNVKIKDFFGKTYKGFSYSWKGSVIQLGSSVAVGLALTIIYNIIYVLFGDTSAFDSPDFSLTTLSPLSIVFYVVALCIIAPIFEEILFRGYVLRSVQRYGNVFAIIFSSAMFGLYHGNFTQSLQTFAGGLVLGYIAIKSNSLIPSIVAHAFNNIIAVAQLFLIQYASENVALIVSLIINFGLPIASIIILIVSRKHLRIKNRNTTSLSNGQCVGTVMISPGILLFLAYAILSMITYMIA